MARRLGWLLFIAVAGWLLVVGTVDLLPAKRASRDAFRELAALGVERTATVVARRDERIKNHDSKFHYRFYVTLEYAHEGRTYRSELPFHHAGLVRDAWERLKVGERVAIKAHPQRPGEFYAPSFLELGESLAPTELNSVMYSVLGLGVAGLLAALVYLKVLRSKPM